MPPDDLKETPGPASPVSAGPATADGEWLSLDALIDELAAADGPVVALSISGGGASGAWQAGVIRGFLEAIERKVAKLGERARNATPRIIIGTSAGALNAFGLLLEYLRSPDGDRCGSFQPEPFLSSLWRVIGSENEGAKFVTGRRAWLVAAATRWLRIPAVRRAVVVALLAAAVALVNPVLFGIFLETRPEGWLETVGRFIVENPVKVTLAMAAILVAVVVWLVFTFGRSLFSNGALQNVLANAAQAGLDGRVPSRSDLLRRRGSYERQQAGMRVVEAWHGKKRPPDFILTATDLTAAWECLFTLSSPATFGRLASSGWLVSEIGGRAGTAPADAAGRCATTADGQLLRCVVASTSIPGVFPSQRIRLGPMAGGAEAVHDFVDGGVLNNSPMNVAVDARATHVISIELDPLHAEPPLRIPSGGAEPNVVQNVARTFYTLLTLATTEDIYKTVSVNRLIRAQALAASPGLSRARLLASELHKKRVVEIYRIAPATRDLGTLEFNGHYPNALASPNPSLVDWLDKGAGDVRTESPFWRATFQAYP